MLAWQSKQLLSQWRKALATDLRYRPSIWLFQLFLLVMSSVVWWWWLGIEMQLGLPLVSFSILSWVIAVNHRRWLWWWLVSWSWGVAVIYGIPLWLVCLFGGNWYFLMIFLRGRRGGEIISFLIWLGLLLIAIQHYWLVRLNRWQWLMVLSVTTATLLAHWFSGRQIKRSN